MTIRRRCPLCAHQAVLLAGRCTETAGTAICGCTCIPGQRSGRASRKQPMNPEAVQVLRAVELGHNWGMGVIVATGLSMTSVYAILKRHRDAGLLARDAGRGCHPDRYRLTDQGNILLASLMVI